MTRIEHFVGGGPLAGFTDLGVVHDPVSGIQTADVALAGPEQVDAAVAAAKAALAPWGRRGIGSRLELLSELRAAVVRNRSRLAEIVRAESGKTGPDSLGEVDRGIEAFSAALGHVAHLASRSTNGAGAGIDVQERRYPLGVIAAISPFNFPVMVPIGQTALAMLCGNTIVLKPSERVPTAPLRLAELYAEAGLPAGVFNVVQGGRTAVEVLLDHPDVAGITFVGSTPVAARLREVGVARGKRVQAFGGGKNHMVVMPDADLDTAADAAVSAAYGAAGQRCMAISVLVPVGDIAAPLVEAIKTRLVAGKDGKSPLTSQTIGPLITADARDRSLAYMQTGVDEGGTLVVDGRSSLPAEGFFVGPALIDHVAPGSRCHIDEIFGPVLSVVRARDYADAVGIIRSHPFGNGAAIFTQDGRTATRFADEVEAGCIGVNVPIPLPASYHGFGGWKASAFTETRLLGPGALEFCTRTKSVVTRWPEASESQIRLGFPTER